MITLANIHSACLPDIQALFTKQGRTSHFKTEKERDDWLNKEIAQLEMTVTRKQQSLAALSKDTQQLNSELMELSQAIIAPSHPGTCFWQSLRTRSCFRGTQDNASLMATRAVSNCIAAHCSLRFAFFSQWLASICAPRQTCE